MNVHFLSALKNILKEYYLKLVTTEAKMKRGKVTERLSFVLLI